MSSSRAAVLLVVLGLVAGCATGRGDTGPAAPVPPPTRAEVAYADTSPAQSLDLWLPPRAPAPAPLVILYHGGGFVGGDKRDIAGKVPPLLDAGYAVASVDYRLARESRFPAAVQDAKAAVRHLRAHAAEYGLDPGRFAAWGESAGGNIAALVGTTGGRSTPFDDPALGNNDASSAVQAVVDWYGPVDFLRRDAQAASSQSECRTPALREADDYMTAYLGAPVEAVPGEAEQSNPVAYIASARTLPAFSIGHGTADCQVPVGQSILLDDALTDAGHRSELHLLDNAAHGDPRFESELLTPTIAWLGVVLGR